MLNQPLGGVPGKKVLLKFKSIKKDEWHIYVDKNIQNLLQTRLLHLLLFHIKVDRMQVLQNPWEIIVKKLFLCSLHMQWKQSPSRIVFTDFAYFRETVNLRNNFFLLKRWDHIHSMHNSLSDTLCFQLSLVKDVWRK